MIYETLLTFPGMTDTVKIDIRVPRKNMLLLVTTTPLPSSKNRTRGCKICGLSPEKQRSAKSMLTCLDF